MSSEPERERPEPGLAPTVGPGAPRPLPARSQTEPSSGEPPGRRLGFFALAFFAASLSAAIAFKVDFQSVLRPRAVSAAAAPEAAPRGPVPASPPAASAQAQPRPEADTPQSSPLPFFADADQVRAVGSAAEEAQEPLEPLAGGVGVSPEGDTIDLVPFGAAATGRPQAAPRCAGCPEAVTAQAGDVDIAGARGFRVVGSMTFIGMCGDSYLYRIRNASSLHVRTTGGNLQGEKWRIDLPPGGSMTIKSSHRMPDSPVLSAQ